MKAKHCRSFYEAAISRLSQSIRMPGFRPGKIPQKVVLQQIGIPRVKAAALERLIDKAWKDTIAQEAIEPKSEAQLKEELQEIIGSGKSKRDAVKELTSKYQLSKRRVYDLSIEISVDET